MHDDDNDVFCVFSFSTLFEDSTLDGGNLILGDILRQSKRRSNQEFSGCRGSMRSDYCEVEFDRVLRPLSADPEYMEDYGRRSADAIQNMV